MVETDSEELRIAHLFSQKGRKRDPMNHCVPLLDNFTDDDDASQSYMVMPLLLEVDLPPFEQVLDIVDLLDQLLEVRQCFLASMLTSHTHTHTP